LWSADLGFKLSITWGARHGRPHTKRLHFCSVITRLGQSHRERNLAHPRKIQYNEGKGVSITDGQF
jgi:hypothetical protein